MEKAPFTPHFAEPDAQEAQFLATLRARVDAALLRYPSQPFADARMWMKACFLVFTYAALWGYLVFLVTDPALGLLAVAMLGFFGASIALNLGHEGSHRTFSRDPKINDMIYVFAMALLGVSPYLWKTGHLRTHHRTVNIPGQDIGIEGNGILRLASHTPWRPIYRWQHLYGPVVYSLYTITWVLFRDWRNFAEKRLSQVPIARDRYWALKLAALKCAYFTFMLILPMALSSFSALQVLLAFLFMHAVSSLFLASQLFSSHLCDEAYFHEPSAAPLGSFTRHHLAATVDIAPGNAFSSFFLGGFNTHAIHHLFPQVCSIYYPQLTRILRDTCREFGMPYLEMTFIQSLASHGRFLKKMGNRPVIQTYEIRKTLSLPTV